MDRDEVGRKIMETTLVMSDGYTKAISKNFMTLAEQEANRKCAIAVNNAAYFILQALGFQKDEIRALRVDQQEQNT